MNVNFNGFGENAATFIADETLTEAGVPVKMKDNGTVAKMWRKRELLRYVRKRERRLCGCSAFGLCDRKERQENRRRLQKAFCNGRRRVGYNNRQRVPCA